MAAIMPFQRFLANGEFIHKRSKSPFFSGLCDPAAPRRSLLSWDFASSVLYEAA
jgi:hypothetical protein